MASQPISRSGHASTIDRIGKEGFSRKSYKDDSGTQSKFLVLPGLSDGFSRWDGSMCGGTWNDAVCGTSRC